MATDINSKNNFLNFKEDFKKDTGLDFSKDNMSIYIQYVNARIVDHTYQLHFTTANVLLNEINFIPGKVSLKMAEMLRAAKLIP